MTAGTFKIFRYNTVVANQRERLGHNLTKITWISQCFQISIHARCKYRFTGYNSGSAKTFPFKNQSISKDYAGFSTHTKAKVYLKTGVMYIERKCIFLLFLTNTAFSAVYCKDSKYVLGKLEKVSYNLNIYCSITSA